ncbi:pyridoxal phosphate-dependent aminotransferase family protein [Flammeovirga sp. OC4]|uniref:aminotransferase class I/II-fold pyridoxal phosphate-dependent enzyme n=1 Tax=unclassified Flammeovirga TaxID=2637820 RepID=UPI0005C5160D|nr:pyridoxal phosphate-dependent aminotransferase family protein [Flammeovirga sp. OC4]MBD0402180.1 pyridoxal phosphate-dependent aminotransferase family protein [Flammeovirga sp. EKP202]
MDLFEKLLQDRGPLGNHSKMAHGYYAFPKLEGEIAPRMTFRGKEVLTWSLNNYLGLANHPEIRKVDADAAAEYGLAYPMGARMMSGNSNLIEEFESELSSFVGKEDTMVLNFGYQGIMSVIDALLDRKDVVVYDSECHACIIDGLRMHVGKRFVFPHNDIENCEKQLQRATKLVEETGGAILLITEGVFGMLGDQGKLKEIADLKDKYQFRMLVDDAHGFGTLGKTGAGAGEEQGCQDKIDIYFSTFAKSMASVGAFISSDEQVIEYLRYNTRSQIFAKTLPMPLVKGNLKRLEMLRNMPELKDKLWEVATALQDGLTSNGFDIGLTDTPVTPVFLQGGQNEAVNMIMDLRENYSIFCSVVVYPVVPKGVIMLRLIPTASHSLEDVEETISAFKAVKHKLESGEYANAEPQIMK